MASAMTAMGIGALAMDMRAIAHGGRWGRSGASLGAGDRVQKKHRASMPRIFWALRGFVWVSRPVKLPA